MFWLTVWISPFSWKISFPCMQKLNFCVCTKTRTVLNGKLIQTRRPTTLQNLPLFPRTLLFFWSACVFLRRKKKERKTAAWHQVWKSLLPSSFLTLNSMLSSLLYLAVWNKWERTVQFDPYLLTLVWSNKKQQRVEIQNEHKPSPTPYMITVLRVSVRSHISLCNICLFEFEFVNLWES